MDAIGRIREVISDKALSLKAFSELLNVPYRTVQRYLAQDRALSAEFLQAMSDKLDVSASWVLSGKGGKYLEKGQIGHGDADFVHIKRFDVEASAGHGVHVSTETSSGSYGFNRKWLERRGLAEKHLSVIAIRGDSMEPDLYDHDLILMDEAQTALKDGHIYVVRYSDGLYVKRIQFLPEGQVHLTSRNSSYPPIAVKHPEADGLKIIGRVVASMHEW